MNGALLVLLAPFPFVLSVHYVLLTTLRSGNFANDRILDLVGHCLDLLLFQYHEFVSSVCRGN